MTSQWAGICLPAEINWVCGLCDVEMMGSCGHSYGVWSKDFPHPIHKADHLLLHSPKLFHGLPMKSQGVALPQEYGLLHRYKIKEFLIVIEEVDALDSGKRGVSFEKPSRTYEDFINIERWDPDLLLQSKKLNFEGDWPEYEKFVYDEMQLWKYRRIEENEAIRNLNPDQGKTRCQSIFRIFLLIIM